MATFAELEQCKRNVLALLDEAGLPEPDRVEFGDTCIRVFWEPQKVCVVVSVDDPPYWAATDDESEDAAA